MNLNIRGRVALITGASTGLGLAAARFLDREGVRLILTDVEEEPLNQARAEFDGDTRALVADLTDDTGVLSLAQAAAEVGPVDILVHTAGITGAKGDPLEMTDADFEDAWQTNFMSAVRLCRTFVKPMADQGWGRVVCVTSENAVQPYPDEAVYNASKAALLNFTKAVSLAYGPKGVLVNTVAPAFIETPMTDKMMEKRAEELGVDFDEAVESFLEEERPYLTLKRRGKPEEVAAVIALLCSDLASFTNGSAYRVDGGAVAAMNI
ncbi:SDR family oxidoreductase [Rhodobacteraceae bacterium CCMM004]|nr:SDR family oxidoreductase [Rhodobacteraceae bacterium CCMM004]